MIDALVHHTNIAQKSSGILKRLGLKKKEYVLATIHRAENTNNQKRLSSICIGGWHDAFALCGNAKKDQT